MKPRLSVWGLTASERKETEVPHIIVTADRTDDREGATEMLRERVNVTDFESDHFATQLVERLGWAVSDADEAERAPGSR